LLFANMGAGQALNGTVFTSTSMIPAITLTDEQETHRNQIYAIGGKDRFGDLIVDYHVAYEDATFHVDRNTGARFEGPTTAISYDNVSRKNLPIFTFPTGFNVNDPTQYSFLNTVNNGDTPLSNSTEVDADHEWSGAVNFAFPIHLLGADDQVRFGGEARFRGKEVNVFRETITAPLPGSLAGLSFPALTYYGGHYSNGPFINIDAIRNLIRSGAAASSGDIFQPGSFLSAQEDIYAGYAEYTAQWGKFGLLAGVRVEATDARYGAFVSTTDAAGDTTLSFLDRPVNYVNPFPTVQFRYNFTPKLVARATYSTGLARPGFEQNTAAASVDFTQSPIAISRGNPNLKPTLGQNFDFDIEAYLPEGGIIELGVFDKEFTNYIARRIEMNVTNDPLAAGQLATVTTFLNIPYAYARGIDAAWHQQFLFLPKPFDGFGIESNITLVASGDLEYTAAQDLTGKDEHGLLPGTSPATWNLAGFYEEDGVTARLSAEYVEHSIFGLGGDKALDSIQDNRLTLDFTAAYQINKRFQVYFDAKNLLNTPLRYYEGEPFRPIQREFYDSTYEAGVRMHFQ
jgi:TonB-dependent receptor